MQAAADECERQEISFTPLIFDSLDGWHRTAVKEVYEHRESSARQTGRDGSEFVSHSISRLSLLLMKGNILVNRIPSAPQGMTDGLNAMLIVLHCTPTLFLIFVPIYFVNVIQSAINKIKFRHYPFESILLLA